MVKYQRPLAGQTVLILAFALLPDNMVTMLTSSLVKFCPTAPGPWDTVIPIQFRNPLLGWQHCPLSLLICREHLAEIFKEATGLSTGVSLKVLVKAVPSGSYHVTPLEVGEQVLHGKSSSAFLVFG